MAKKKSRKSNGKLINAALYILIGVLLCVFRASVLDWLMTAVGALLIVFGILKCLDNALFEGLVMAGFGVVVIWGGWMFLDLVLLILGVGLTIKGLLDLFQYAKRNNGVAVVASLFTLVVGLALILAKWIMLDWLFIAMGIILILDGLMMAVGKNKR